MKDARIHSDLACQTITGNKGNDPVYRRGASMLINLNDYFELITYEQSPEEKIRIRSIAREIRQLRKQHRYSRSELALKLSIAEEVILIVEHGDGNLKTAQELLTHLTHLVQAQDIATNDKGDNEITHPGDKDL